MLLHNKRKFFAICNWMQSLEESALDRSAGLFRPPGKPTIADDDDHHCRRRRASRLLSHFTCFFRKASVTGNVFLHTFGPMQVCAICMHCSMPKVDNVELSIAASPGVLTKPNTWQYNVCMKAHLHKKCRKYSRMM